MHKHLTWTDRLKIEKGLKEGLKPCAIADRLHVHNTTIYRELKRGRYTHLNSDLTTEERYSPEIAQQRYEENLKAKGSELKIGNDYELSAFIEKKIGDFGQLAKDGMTLIMVTHEMRFARRISDRIIMMENGSIVADKTVAEIDQDPKDSRIRRFMSNAEGSHAAA